jgi:hypothetical protein
MGGFLVTVAYLDAAKKNLFTLPQKVLENNLRGTQNRKKSLFHDKH